jgi:hypothetical protein
MDYSTIGGIAGLVSLVIVIADRVVQLVNHKRVRSKCCGKTAEASLDVENTTPPSERPLIHPGLITVDKDGKLQHYDAALKKMVPYEEK